MIPNHRTKGPPKSTTVYPKEWHYKRPLQSRPECEQGAKQELQHGPTEESKLTPHRRHTTSGQQPKSIGQKVQISAHPRLDELKKCPKRTKPQKRISRICHHKQNHGTYAHISTRQTSENSIFADLAHFWCKITIPVPERPCILRESWGPFHEHEWSQIYKKQRFIVLGRTGKPRNV